MNANLENMWALVTKTIAHPLHQVKKSNCLIQEAREKSTWEKSLLLSKQVESGLKFEATCMICCAQVFWGLACRLLLFLQN